MCGWRRLVTCFKTNKVLKSFEKLKKQHSIRSIHSFVLSKLRSLFTIAACLGWKHGGHI